MASTDPIRRWSAFELHRRMQRAQSNKERNEVRNDIDRARRDPAFRERLAEIAQSGEFATGPHRNLQLGLGAMTAGGFLAGGPVGAGLSLLGSTALAGYGAANIGESFQRKQEGLPWMGQAATGALDIATLPLGGSTLIRRLVGPAAKAASNVTSTSFKYRPRTTGSAYQPVSDTIQTPGWGPGGRISADAPVTPQRTWTGTGYQPVSPPIKTPGYGPGGTLSVDAPTPLPVTATRTGTGYQPVSPPIKTPGYGSTGSQFTVDAPPPRQRPAYKLPDEGTKIDPEPTQQILPQGAQTKNIISSRDRIRKVWDTETTGRRTRTGVVLPKVAPKIPSAGATATAKNAKDLADELADTGIKQAGTAANVATTLEDTVLQSIKGSKKYPSTKIRDLSDSRLKSILARRQTGGTGFAKVEGFDEEKEIIKRVLAERKAAFQARTGVIDDATAAVDEVVDTPMRTVDDLEWGEFERAVSDMENAELKLSGLNAVSHMIVNGADDVFEAFKRVPFKETTKGTMSQGSQRGLLRGFFSGAHGVQGSSPAHIFGSRAAHRPGTTSPKELFKPFKPIGPAAPKQIHGKIVTGKDGKPIMQTPTAGPGGQQLLRGGKPREKGPRVLETWRTGQGKITSPKEFRIEKELNVKRVKSLALSLHKKGKKPRYTPEMVAKRTEGELTPAERVIHDQAVAMSVEANRADIFKALVARKIGTKHRIQELVKDSDKDVLREFTGAFETFMRKGTHKQRNKIIDLAREFNDDIAGLLAAITAAEMMAIAGDPRATIGQPT